MGWGLGIGRDCEPPWYMWEEETTMEEMGGGSEVKESQPTSRVRVLVLVFRYVDKGRERDEMMFHMMMQSVFDETLRDFLRSTAV